MDELGAALKKGMDMEMRIADFYLQYVRRISDPGIRQLIFAMVEGSTKHYLDFRKEYMKRKFDIEMPDVSLNDIQLVELLEEGMREEVGAQQAYQKLLDVSEDSELCKLLEETIEDEKAHEQMLRKAHAGLLKKMGN